jgi:hypothetical protein
MKLWPKFVETKIQWDVWVPVFIGFTVYAILYFMGFRYGFE